MNVPDDQVFQDSPIGPAIAASTMEESLKRLMLIDHQQLEQGLRRAAAVQT